ncbi:hypothetical protein B0A49_01456 [Cryomyces minteri]|uniref:Uncharacterized protein n=1 Tax=Cryomyces minteri TaxID=331657 RepID=A0A4U0XQC7_9PEZI|nr:hypothetical protein B0A49_01456 [Cryomyces minteri]
MAEDSENSSDGQSTPRCERPGSYKDADDTIAALAESLDKVEAVGSFASSEVEPNPVQPGLYIEGIGIVGLPLGERGAKAIIQASHQAPFGKGNETLVDVMVRKTRELNADQFQLRNPAWPKFFQTILGNTAEALGVHVAGLRAELYKLLLFADVMHQIIPVTAGYRFVLTYNLVRVSPGVGYSLATLDDLSLKLKDVLRSWHQSAVHTDYAPRKLIYILEHEYSDASLQYDQLKGKDQLCAKHLKNVGAEMGFDVFLASLEREVTEVQRNVDIDESDIVQENPIDRDPDEEDYEGRTGNEGCNATHWYRDIVLVLAPHQYKIDLSLDATKHDRSKVKTLIDNVASKFVSEPSSKAEGELFRLCESIVETNEARRKDRKNRPSASTYGYHYKINFSDDAVGKVMDSVISARPSQDGKPFRESRVLRQGDGPFGSVWRVKRGDASKRFRGASGWTTSIPVDPVHKITNASSPRIGGDVRASVDGMIPSDWITARVKETLRLHYEPTKKDGVALADFVGKHTDNAWLFQE